MRASDDGGKSGNTLATPHHTTLPYKWVDVCWCHHAPLVSLNVVVVDTHHGVDETRARMCGTHHSLTGVCVPHVVLKWQWLPSNPSSHTHVEECEEWHQRPRSHTSVAVCGQMDSMALVLVLVLPIQCDGASLVTITTLVLFPCLL